MLAFFRGRLLTSMCLCVLCVGFTAGCGDDTGVTLPEAGTSPPPPPPGSDEATSGGGGAMEELEGGALMAE